MAEQNNQQKQRKKKIAAAVIASACVVSVAGLFFLNTGDLSFNFEFPKKETEQTVYDGKGQHRLSLYDPDWE